MPRKIYIAGPATGYASWMDGQIVTDLDKADFLLLTGGTDVDPRLYGHLKHPYTQEPDQDRDRREMDLVLTAIAKGLPIVGICRGAQFLCAAAGGKLIQHQSNFCHTHPMVTHDGEIITVTSDHHQAQYPWGMPTTSWKLLGWTKNLCEFHEGENRAEMVNGLVPGGTEVEDAYYKRINALAIQSHPEWMHGTMPGYDKSITHHRNLLTKFLKGDL